MSKHLKQHGITSRHCGERASCWLSGKESAYQCRGRRGCRFHPWVGDPWRRKWQYSKNVPRIPSNSCLKSPMDRRAWQVTVHGIAESWTQVSGWACTRTVWRDWQLHWERVKWDLTQSKHRNLSMSSPALRPLPFRQSKAILVSILYLYKTSGS